ncbi:MAG TPA: GNAT family N-acetyltransferase [Acidobacteriaceae bacterium]
MIRLETDRLILREMTMDDAPALHAVFGDAETMRWFPQPYSFSEMQEGITRQIGRYPSGTGLLAMILKETAAVIGDCGLIWQGVEGVDEPEIGYHVQRAYWNRGFATEAARAVMDYAFTTSGCDHVISMIRPENLPSRRVAEKNGLTVDRIVFWRGYDHCVYKITKATAQ